MTAVVVDKSAAPEGPYSIELLAEDAVGLMDKLGLEKVQFCGLSMGKMVGQMLATHYCRVRLSMSHDSDLAGLECAVFVVPSVFMGFCEVINVALKK